MYKDEPAHITKWATNDQHNQWRAKVFAGTIAEDVGSVFVQAGNGKLVGEIFWPRGGMLLSTAIKVANKFADHNWPESLGDFVLRTN